MRPLKLLIVLGAVATLSFAGAARAAVPNGRPVDGIRCDRMEGAVLHIHQHLAIFDHGKPVGVPDDVGRPFTAQCFYWLHTHTPDGIIHIESPTQRIYTLGNFFDVWHQPLSATQVAGASGKVTAIVNGKPCRVVTTKDGSNSTTVTTGSGGLSGTTTVTPGGGSSITTISPGGNSSSVAVGSSSSSSSSGDHSSAAAGSDCVIYRPEKK